MSIRLKILLLVTACLIMSGIAIQHLSTNEYRSHFRSILLEQGRLAAQELQLRIRTLQDLGLYLEELHQFEHQLTRAADANANISHILISGPDKKVLYRSQHAPATLGSVGESLSLSDSMTFIQLDITDPNGISQGQITVILSNDAINTEVQTLSKHLLTFSSLTILVVIALLSTLLWFSLGRPLHKLLYQIQTASLEADHKPNNDLAKRSDEIGLFARTLKELMARLSATRDALAEHAALLEQRVEQRTRELEAANLTLRDDIKRREELEKELTEIANTDTLTGLPNRLFFMHLLERRFQHAARHHQKLALMLMDLNGFKNINDQFGHASGDQVLKMIARRVSETSRLSDSFSRLGGDEFVLLVEDYESKVSLQAIASKIQDLVQIPIEVEGKNHYMSISIGIAESDDMDTPEMLMQAADRAMYIAKSNQLPHYFHHPDVHVVSTNKHHS